MLERKPQIEVKLGWSYYYNASGKVDPIVTEWQPDDGLTKKQTQKEMT